ncbi:nudix hydrolase 3 [Mucor ambiguus]|uniref:Nudix hydrolase 3 n=1 Tax=Mucor ambiguus TaxID=91626 RepID=A0A0C9M3C6_9FUNG|nr:nudix hydrolase 3 [Mucor ambiguus]
MLSRSVPIAFDTTTLSLFSKRLLTSPKFKLNYKPNVKDAAVLVPLCVVEGKPSILFTVRNINMRTHSGEISFPGGKTDESDSSTQFTALRETKEEIGIDAESIDILGCYSALPNKTGSLKVYPYVGFIKDQVDLTKFNPDEVSSVFTLPIDYLIQPEVRQLKQFRESKMKYTEFKVPDHIEGEKQIWGLTSFILDGVLRKIMPEYYP